MAIVLNPSFAVHPGLWLRDEFVEPQAHLVTGLAARVGVTRQALSNLLNGHSNLSATMAIRFEQAFGVSAQTLLRMQAAHDLASTRKTVEAGLVGA